MSFEEAENDAPNGVSAKQKIIGVIVLTDNRKQPQPEKSAELDFKSSAFKQTEIDPLQYHKNELIVAHEENIYAQLYRRVQQLEERVRLLSNSEGIDIGQAQSEGQKVKKKNRRKFKQLSRNQICTHCQKLYGSQTSLKHHIKLKHLNQKEGSSESQ